MLSGKMKKLAAESLGVKAHDAVDLMNIGGGLLIMTFVMSMTVIAVQYVKGKQREVPDGETQQCQRVWLRR